MNEKLIEFCNYIQPIVNGCGGFIKTTGYVTHIPGRIILMSFDMTYITVIDIPVIYDIVFTSQINKFLQLKDDESKSRLFKNTYFVSWNIVQDSMITYSKYYSSAFSNCIYYEPDCNNIPGFTEAVNQSSILNINILDGTEFYKIPASKAITPINKGDSCSLEIYENPQQNIVTVKWKVYKKKFKLYVNIYSNILIL